MFVTAQALLGIAAGLLSIAALVDGQATVLTISQVGGGGGSSTMAGVTIGSSILFSCNVPNLASYTFTSTELHAQVSGADVLICSASTSGSCSINSQGAPFSSRSITVSVPTGVGTTFTITNAVVSDSINYYCKIQTSNILYTQAANTWTQLQVYSLPITPVCWFTGGTSVFAAGSSLPSINCWSNVGAPYGWLQITTSGTIGSYSGSGIPSFFTLSNSTVLQTNGTYSMTYTLTYTGGYTLSANNNGDSVTCIAYNSYANTYLGSYSVGTPLYFQVQYAVTNIQISLPAGSALSLTQSGTSYTLTATQGLAVTFTCSAAGNPTPTYAWTRSSGQNQFTSSSAQVTVTLSVVETTILLCTASNSPSVLTSTPVTATLNIVVSATTTTAASTTPGVASAGLSGGAIAGIVIAVVVIIALIIIFAVWCTRCPPGSMKKTSKPQSQQLQPLQSSTLQSEPRAPAYEADDRKQPLSITSEMDIPYGGGAFDDSPRSRKPIVDPHAQSAAEYLDLTGGAYGNEALPVANDDKGYNQYASQPTTPNGNMTAPPTYPGSSTMPRGGQYGTQPNANAYGSMNGYTMA